VTRIPLSVVIITYNEEENIARCISSVKDVADEIVVVDSFSTDNTVAIASTSGARIVQNKFAGHIEQKNFAITQARFPHILSLDADEALDEQLALAVSATKLNWVGAGYTMNRLNNYCGKWIWHGAWYPDVKLRLWDSRLGAWRGTNPHDRFDLEGNAVVSHLKGHILHYSYKSVADHRKKINYFSTIAANAYFREGRRSSFFRIWISPVFRFVRDFFFKLGFLDGRKGWIIALLTAKEVKLKYKKLAGLR
jgi:glycosyltransferase involved in cell wall biosynthesis